MIEVVQTDEFDKWIRKLNNREARRRVLRRVDRLATGNPGDVRPIGRGISELKENYGPGYRIYYLQDGELLVILLIGGDKSSQKRDIQKAHQLADEWRADKKEAANGSQ